MSKTQAQVSFTAKQTACRAVAAMMIDVQHDRSECRICGHAWTTGALEHHAPNCFVALASKGLAKKGS